MSAEMKALYAVMREQQKKIQPALAIMRRNTSETARLWHAARLPGTNGSGVGDA